MSRFPLNLEIAGGFYAITGASQQHVLRPSPGPAWRVRVWGYGLSSHISNPAAVVDAFLFDGAGGQVHIDRTSGMIYLPGGYALAPSTALTIKTEATAAANVRLWAFYTVERVA